jgi:predicted GNAT family acetyltransferase
MEIQHNRREGNGTFFIEENGEQLAELTYSMRNGKILVILHTSVDSKIEGKGIGRQLVEAAVVFARENGFKIKPLCPFASALFKRNEAYREIESA